MARSRILRHDELPDSSDPIWIEWSEFVLDALDVEGPLTTEQLKSFARSERFEMGRLINALSWLDLRGLVKADRSNGHVLWLRSTPKAPTVPQPLPKCCPRCNGSLRIEPERIACIPCGHSIYAPVTELD